MLFEIKTTRHRKSLSPAKYRNRLPSDASLYDNISLLKTNGHIP